MRGRSGRCCIFEWNPPPVDPRNHAKTSRCSVSAKYSHAQNNPLCTREERQQENDDMWESRNRAENPEPDRGVFSPICNNLRNRPGKGPDRLRGNLTGNSPLPEPRRALPPTAPSAGRRRTSRMRIGLLAGGGRGDGAGGIARTGLESARNPLTPAARMRTERRSAASARARSTRPAPAARGRPSWWQDGCGCAGPRKAAPGRTAGYHERRATREA